MGAAADADAYAAEEDKTPQACQTMCMCILFCLCLTILAGVIWLFNFLVRDIEINRVDPTFRLHSATVSLLKNASACDFTATWDVTLVASNPNHKLDIYYDTLQASIFYNANRVDSYRARVLLATKPLPPPSALGTRAETTCSFRIEAASAYVGDDVVKEISEGRARGMVRFELNLLATYEFPSWYYWTYPKLFKASCNPVEFGFSPDNWVGTAQSSACEGIGDLSHLVLHIAR